MGIGFILIICFALTMRNMTYTPFDKLRVLCNIYKSIRLYIK